MPEPKGNNRRGNTPIFDDVQKAAKGDMPKNPIVAGPNRTLRAKEYEAKIDDLFFNVMKQLAGSPGTVSDAAVIIAYGNTVSAKTGDLADKDKHVRKAVDWITSGTDNPYMALGFAVLPMVAQIIRNHEMEAPVRVGLRIPFTQRTFKVPFRIRLRNPFLRRFTQPGNEFTARVMTQPDIMRGLMSAGIDVAYPGYERSAE